MKCQDMMQIRNLNVLSDRMEGQDNTPEPAKTVLMKAMRTVGHHSDTSTKMESG